MRGPSCRGGRLTRIGLWKSHRARAAARAPKRERAVRGHASRAVYGVHAQDSEPRRAGAHRLGLRPHVCCVRVERRLRALARTGRDATDGGRLRRGALRSHGGRRDVDGAAGRGRALARERDGRVRVQPVGASGRDVQREPVFERDRRQLPHLHVFWAAAHPQLRPTPTRSSSTRGDARCSSSRCSRASAALARSFFSW